MSLEDGFLYLGDLRFYGPPIGGAVGNGLLNALIAYWPGNEAAGNALDLHANALHLTDTNTVTSAAGLVYPTARQYTAASAERHTRPADDAFLSTGDVDFTIAAWANFDSFGAMRAIVAKRNAPPQWEYWLHYNASLNLLELRVSSAGNNQFFIQAASAGAPSIATWYLVIGWHNSVADTINIQVNNGAVDSKAHAVGVLDSTSPFVIGRDAAAVTLMDGRIGPTMFWKSAAGGGGVLSAAQRTALYAGGAGLPYAGFTV